jgi:hypothetical protein
MEQENGVKNGRHETYFRQVCVDKNMLGNGFSDFVIKLKSKTKSWKVQIVRFAPKYI